MYFEISDASLMSFSTKDSTKPTIPGMKSLTRNPLKDKTKAISDGTPY